MNETGVKLEVGDVFSMPFDDERVTYGQIVERWGASGGHYYLAIYDAIRLREDNVDLDDVVAQRVALLGISTDALLQHGHWQVVGNHAVDVDGIPWPAYKEGVSPPGTFDVVDYTGRRRRRATAEEIERLAFRPMPTPFVLEKAFQALNGIGDWHEVFDGLLPVPDELTSARLLPR
jgi:hypothetical protein